MTTETTPKPETSPLTSREYQLVEIMAGMYDVRFTDIASKAQDVIGLPSAQVASLLERLSHKGIIKRTGKARHFRYSILKNPEELQLREPKKGGLQVIDVLVDALEQAKARETVLVREKRQLEDQLDELQHLVPTLDTHLLARIQKLGVKLS